MNYQAVSELITSSNHNVLIVGESASEVDSFLNKLNITDYKYLISARFTVVLTEH
ncbi:hypothetical protein BvCmsNSNP002_03928 [Escherichia coli]|uniref:hypothetical protein n=1 Tax=Escherichia coli TaxID=562 RepID=UPI0010C56398|nr:hypothetical protein [Escherichia coli]MCV2944431.1 hypothetical protein [Escherichia coli]GDJ42280.1 hypothetical protein BvCmsKSNP120_01573 [Escherichia coli]GDM55948.1 hypothetical protein BvCmsNSNP002_03928 [Escherichia coli]